MSRTKFALVLPWRENALFEARRIVLETLYFKVADLYFAIHAESSDLLKHLLPSYAPFHVAQQPAAPLALDVTLNDGAVDASAQGVELGQFDCGGTNHGIYRTEQGYKVVISTVEGHLASAMTTNADFSKCVVSIFGNESDRAFGMGNAMMIAFAFAAAYYNTILMHASVTMNNGYGYLFLGKSGTGKSTHSMLWRQHIEGSDLLNDDNPAVRVMENGETIVYGTPWSGKTPCYRNLQLPVGAFLRLEQHSENIISREKPLQAFASVLSSCSTMIWDKPSYKHITKTVEQVVSSVPAFYLKCRADEAAAQLSYNTIAHK